MSSKHTTAPFWLNPLNPDVFPNVELALREPDGLLAIGGDLSPPRLLAAYRRGIFPWYSDDQPILWWSPNPRSVLFPKQLKISRSLSKTIRKDLFQVTLDRCFQDVIEHCAQTRKDGLGTWITNEMIQAYVRLHQQGFAHSVECWKNNTLVGGLYGIAIGRVFFGESMFSHVSDASKVALVFLARQLQAWGFKLIDCQVQSAHLDTLGAVNIPRQRFVEVLAQYCNLPAQTLLWNFDVALIEEFTASGGE